MPRYRPSELAQLGVRPKKGLSQHFLIDQNIIRKTVEVAQIGPGDRVLEIGPGPGAITELLLKAGARVTAVEKDPLWAEKLQELQTDPARLHIVCQDVLDFSLDSLEGNHWKVVANLPYHITTPILQKLLPAHAKFDSLTVFVQKEFALRMSSKKGSKTYSSFSLFVEAYSEAACAFYVKPTSFMPPPSVDSAVVHLQLHPFPFPFVEESFFTFTRSAFGQRRKMIRSSLKSLVTPERIETGLVALKLPPTARPEELSLEEFASLFRHCQPLEKIEAAEEHGH